MENYVVQTNEKKERQLFFESGVYDDGFEVLKDYLNSNYASCKVCFISCSQDYLLYKAFVEKLSVQGIYILSDDVATNNNLLEVQNVCADCDLLVCLDYSSVNYCKKMQTKLKINCFYFFASVPPIDVFLPFFHEFDGKQYSLVACNSVKSYIINYTDAKSTSRQGLIPCFCSLIAYYCAFLDCYINSYLFSKKLDETFSSRFERFSNLLSNALNQIRFMPSNFVDNLYALTLDFVDFALEENITNLPSMCLSSVYIYLTKQKVSTQEVAMFASQIFVHLYSDFFAKFKHFSNTGVNIQKKQEMYKKYLKSDYFVDEGRKEKEQTSYLLMRFSKKLQQKCASFCTLVDKFVDKLLDLYEDSGYSLYKNFDKDKILLALYFVPDLIKDKSLLHILCDYGILDSIV